MDVGRQPHRPPTPAPIRVLVVEDHFLARLAITTLLADDPGFTVVGAATSGAQAVELHRQLRPDVTLMDLRLPDLDGVWAINEIRRATPAARLLVLSNYESDVDVRRALGAGAQGFLKKDAEGDELLAAIRCVHGGQRYLPAHLEDRLGDPCDTTLTAREQKVLELVFAGLSNREIGARLQLTPGTVRIYVSGVFDKLGVSRRTEAIAVALKRGLLRAE